MEELNALLQTGKITKLEYDIYILFVVDERGSSVYKQLMTNTLRSAVVAAEPTIIAIHYGKGEVFRELQDTINHVDKLREELRHGKSDV